MGRTRQVYDMASSTVKTTYKVIRSFIAEGGGTWWEERGEWRSMSCRGMLKSSEKNASPTGSNFHTWRLSSLVQWLVIGVIGSEHRGSGNMS